MRFFVAEATFLCYDYASIMSNYSLSLRCGEAALPPPLWGRCPQNFHILWAERAILLFYPLSHALRRASSPRGRAKGAEW